MNPVYSIMESRHRWLILAGIAFLAGLFGAIEMLALVWPHMVARVWLLAFLALSLYLLVRAVLDWKQRVLTETEMSGQSAAQPSNGRGGGSHPLRRDR